MSIDELGSLVTPHSPSPETRRGLTGERHVGQFAVGRGGERVGQGVSGTDKTDRVERCWRGKVRGYRGGVGAEV